MVPWAALPGAKPNTILLEDLTIATVPNGKWLLEQLSFLRTADAAQAPLALRALGVGAIDYGRPSPGQIMKYPPLTAAQLEPERVLATSKAAKALQGVAATPAAVKLALMNARIAHFATHGYFDEKGAVAERLRVKGQMEKWTFAGDGSRRLGRVRHPLSFVGLAFSGANDPKNDGILTGLGVVDLPLENLNLCVLSACETGLGEHAEGEGVIGLQRAFHVAGCPNVVASLWKVNDAATAALMATFYHELSVDQRSPIAALREAQLTIYRNPDLIPDLAGERGAPRLQEAVVAKLDPNAPRQATTDTKLWAAFVLSGVGR